MASKRERYVTIGGRTYGPDDDMPADVAKAVSNPKVGEPIDMSGAGAVEAPAPDTKKATRPATAKGE